MQLLGFCATFSFRAWNSVCTSLCDELVLPVTTINAVGVILLWQVFGQTCAGRGAELSRCERRGESRL